MVRALAVLATMVRGLAVLSTLQCRERMQPWETVSQDATELVVRSLFSLTYVKNNVEENKD